MSDVKSFLFFNGLKQKDLADYLGIAKGRVSQICSGSAELTAAQLHKLLTNDRGWNTELLKDDRWLRALSARCSEESNSSQEVMKLRTENSLLREQLAWAQGIIENFIKGGRK